MKWYIYLLCILLFSACRKDEKKQLKELVQQWYGKEIIFPKNIVFTQLIKDTIDFQFNQSGYKVLFYVDSVGCLSCKLQLSKWKDFIHQIDSMVEGDVPFLFFLELKDTREMLTILRRENFNIPVCIDTKGSLRQLNKFPDNPMFHAFLLDSNNLVSVIGNPVLNLSVQDLYMRKIKGNEKQPILPDTKLQVTQWEYDMGLVKLNQVKGLDIYLYNAGHEPFRIRGVTTSCNCTKAVYNWRDIQPGEKDRISIFYEADSSGDFLRTVTVYGNIPEKLLTLTLVGTVQ